MKKTKLLDLNDAIQHPGRHVEFDITAELSQDEELRLHRPVTGQINAVSAGNALLIKGDFQTAVVLKCSRCLMPVQVEISFNLEEHFAIEGTPAGHSSSRHARVDDEEPFQLFDGNSLRYEELIRQNLWLNLPMRPLCGEVCAGHYDGNDNSGKGRSEFSVLADLLGDEPGACK